MSSIQIDSVAIQAITDADKAQEEIISYQMVYGEKHSISIDHAKKLITQLESYQPKLNDMAEEPNVLFANQKLKETLQFLHHATLGKNINPSQYNKRKKII